MTLQGHILTNAYIVSPQGEEISVTLASLERVNARLLGWKHWADLVLLQLDLDTIEQRKFRFS